MKPPIRPYSRIPPEPRWRTRQQLRQTERPTGLTNWLFDAGSLTRRLQQLCPGRFRVRVLRQYRGRPLLSEAHALGLAKRNHVWVREVQLLCQDQAWVFARTLIPLSALSGPCQHLAHLGTRPLGEVLFTDPNVHRGPVEVACIQAGQRLHRRAFGDGAEQPEAIWGRRSVFRMNHRLLLVSEIFLPDLPLYPVHSA